MKIEIAIIILLGPSCAVAADLINFTPGSPIKSSEINANFQELGNRNQIVQGQANALESRMSTLESSSPQGPNSVLTLFSTATTFDGAGTRRAMNGACQSVDSNSGFCSLERIQNASANGHLVFSSAFNGGWIDKLPPVMQNTQGSSQVATTYYYDLSTITCGGWLSASGGSIFMTTSGAITNSSSCASANFVVCCK